MKKKIIWAIIIIIIIILLGSYLSNDKDTGEGYSIGAIVPLSGGAASIGNPFANGMRMAVDETNANGGVNGKEVVLEVEDSEFSGVKSVSAAQHLLSTINPDVFDVLFALPAQALSPVFKEEEKPFLEWDYSREVVDNNEFAFKTGFDAKTGCEDLVHYAKTEGLYKKLGVLMSKTPYNQACFDGVKKAETDVSEYWYEYGTEDFRTLLTKINSDGVDMVVTIPVDPEPIQIFKQLNDLGYPINVMCFTSSECIYQAVKSVASDETLEGTLSFDFVPEDLLSSEFATAFKEKYPNESSSTAVTWAAQGYDDALMIMTAMEKCTPKDSKCLVKSLNKIKNYDSPINSNGFTDGIQNLKLRRQIYQNGEWADLKD